MTVKTEDALTEIACDLGEIHFEYKLNERTRDLIRKQFFAAASGTIRPAKRTITLPEDVNEAGAEAIIEYTKMYWPGWLLVSEKEGKAIIEQDPDFVEYSVVVEWDQPQEVDAPTPTKPNRKITAYGYKVERQIAYGSPMVDMDRLKLVEPLLYEGVTGWPTWTEPFFDTMPLDDFEGTMRSYCIERVLRDDLTPEQVAALKDYTMPGKPQAKLSVKYASAEEAGQG